MKDNPKDLQPVMALIHHLNSLGLSKYYEVVYFDSDDDIRPWKSYSGSKTFKDGEKVVGWVYADSCILTLPLDANPPILRSRDA